MNEDHYTNKLIEHFQPMFEKVLSIPKPFSMVELRLDGNYLQNLKNLLHNTPEDIIRRLTINLPYSLPTGVRFTFNEMFGSICIFCASEISRDNCPESHIWPEFKKLYSLQLQKTLLPSGQPSEELKRAFIAAAERLEFRNVYGWSGTLEYFDTIKLQFGFTHRGAKNRLAEWLSGFGMPLAVMLLSGMGSRQDLVSQSFLEMWKTLRDYRQDRISIGKAKTNLLNNPWIRAGWIDELLKQAKSKLHLLHVHPSIYEDGLNDGSAEQEIVQGFCLREKNQKAKLNLCINREIVELYANEQSESKIFFCVNGQRVGYSTRQSQKHWEIPDRIPCEPDNATNPNLAPSTLAIETVSGEILKKIDLTSFGLHEDIFLFDRNNGESMDPFSKLDMNRRFAILCDTNFTLTPKTNRIVDSTHYKQIYLVDAPWSANLKLMVDGDVYWEPLLEEDTSKETITLHITSMDDNIIALGSKTILKVTGCPEDVKQAEIIIKYKEKISKPRPLLKQNGCWITENEFKLTPRLVKGLDKILVRLQRPGSRRCYPVKRSFRVCGAAVQNHENEYMMLNNDEPFNIRGGRNQCLIFHDFEEQPRLYEGFQLIKHLPKSGIISISDFSAWGQPVTLNRNEKLIGSVVDSKCVDKYTPSLLNSPAKYKLISPCEFDNVFFAVVWDYERKNSPIKIVQNSLIKVENERIWELDSSITTISQTAALTYNGTCIGSYWDEESVIQYVERNPSIETFAALRWFHFPVLSTKWLDKLKRIIQSHPYSFIDAWLNNKGLPRELKWIESEKCIDSIIREYFWDYRSDSPDFASFLHKSFAGSQNKEACIISIIKAGNICPSFVWKMVTNNSNKDWCMDALQSLLNLTNENSDKEDIMLQAINRLKNLCSSSLNMDDEELKKLMCKYIQSFTNQQNIEIDADKLRQLFEIDRGRKYLTAAILLVSYRR